MINLGIGYASIMHVLVCSGRGTHTHTHLLRAVINVVHPDAHNPDGNKGTRKCDVLVRNIPKYCT